MSEPTLQKIEGSQKVAIHLPVYRHIMAICPTNQSRIRLTVDYPGLEGLGIQTTFGVLNGRALELKKNHNRINEIYNDTKNKMTTYAPGGVLAPMTQPDMEDFFNTLITLIACEKILFDKPVLLCFLDGQ